MKIDFDITTAEYTVIRDILGRLLPPESTVWVFGSRAKGTARFNSDLDLAVESKGAFPRSQFYALKEAFDDAPLSFRVDIVDLAEVDAGFQKIIKEHRVSFQMPKTRQKHLRFPGFEGKWESKHLGEIVLSIDAGWSPLCLERPANKDEWGVLKTTAVTWDGYDDNQNKALPRKQEPRTNLLVTKGDILITRAGPISRVAVVAYVNNTRPKLMISDKLMRARTSKQVNGDFIARLLGTTHIQNYYSARKSGLAEAQANISQQILSRTPINLPSLSEQKKIAAFLGVVDAKIAALRAKVSGLETCKRGLMQALFSQTLRFTEPDGTAFSDWEEKRLGELGNFTGGGTPDTENAAYWSGNIPWISSSDIRENDLRGPLITRWINEQALRESATKIVPANSILIVSRVGVGKLTVSRQDICTSQDFTNFTPNAGNVQFLAYWMLNNTNELLRLCQGTSIKGLTSEDLKSLVLSLPHSDEQAKIAETLSAMDAKIQAVAAQVSQMEKFKKGLLQQMFV